MRSPQIQLSISPKRFTTTTDSIEKSNKANINHNYDNDDDSTTSTTVSFHSSKSKSSFTPPQPRASLSSFAAPSWNNGSIGEHNSNVRVVARIKPIDSIRTSNNNINKEAIFAITSNGHDDDGGGGYVNNTYDITNTSSIPFKSPSSRKGVADIAARFNTNNSPIAPPNNNSYKISTTSTTPTKFMKSPSRIPSVVGSAAKTPIHTNVNVHEKYRNNIVPSTSLRQSFIPPPASPSLSVTSGTGSSNLNNTYTKQSTVQTISAGLTEPKQFDFDAVS